MIAGLSPRSRAWFFDQSVVKPHVTRQEKDRAGAKFVSIAAVLELPGVVVPVVKMAVLDREHFAIHAISAFGSVFGGFHVARDHLRP